MVQIADALIRYVADTKDLERSIGPGGPVDKAAEAGGKSVGGRFKSALGKAAPMIGAAAGAMMVGAIESGAVFEDQLRTINTVAKMTDDQLFAMGDELQALSRETGKTTDDLTGGLYDLVSAGVPAGEAVEVLRSSAILATGALGTTGEAVDLVTSALGAWKKPAKDATKVTDIFAQAVADGKTTVADLAGGISTVAPMAAAMGISLEEVAAQTAVMTLSGDSAAQAMTRIRNAMSALLTPNETLNKISERTGINWANLAKEKGLAVALEELRIATNGNNEEFGKALGSSEALTLAFAITGENADAMAAELDKVTKAGEEGGVALGQYTEKSKSGVEQGKRLSAWLKTIGQDFGGLGSAVAPFVMVLTSLGPMISRAIGAGLGGLAGILTKKVVAAVVATGIPAKLAGTGVGTMIGTAMGAAIPIAMVAAAGIGIALAFKALVLDPGLQAQSREIGASVGEQIVKGTTDELEVSKSAIEKGIADINALPLGGLLYGDQVRDLETQLDVINAEIATRAAAGGKEVGAAASGGVADGIEEAAPAVLVAADKVVEMFGTSLAGVKAASKQTGADGMAALAAGITAAREKPLTAFDTLKAMLKTAMTPMAEVARLHGEMTSKALAKGLVSGDPAVRAQAAAAAMAIADRLGTLAAAGGKSGKAAMAELDKGIRSKIPAVREASLAAKGAAVAALEATKGPAGAAGTAAGNAFASRLRASIKAGDYTINASVGFTLPGHAAGVWKIANDHVAVVHQGEMIVPAQPSEAIRSGQASLAAGGLAPSGAQGGSPINVTVYNPAPEPASTSTKRELRKLQFAGVIA